MTIEVRILPRKKFDEEDTCGLCRKENDKTIIELPKGASTRTRLHEIGHGIRDNFPDKMTINDFVEEELEAESFAFRRMDKVPTWKISLSVLNQIILDDNVNANQAFNSVLSGLNHVGVKVSKSDRSLLWQMCLGLERTRNKTAIGEKFSENYDYRYDDAYNRLRQEG